MNQKGPKRINTFLTEAVAWKLKKLRVERGLTQENVHEDTGANLQRCESGKVNLSIVLIGILCDYYGVSLPDFFSDITTR